MKTSLRGLAVFILLVRNRGTVGVRAHPDRCAGLFRPNHGSRWRRLKRQIPERDFIIEVLDHGGAGAGCGEPAPSTSC